MKLKGILLTLTMTFGLGNCIWFGEPLSPYTSEGSQSAPITLYFNTYHSGQVDGVNSSFYAYYGGGYTSYLIDMTGLTADVDMYIYVNSWSDPYYYSSINTGTTSEIKNIVTSSTSDIIYIEADPFDPEGSMFDLIIY